MCCNNFWKKTTVFSITLLLGFFAADLFRNEEQINIKVSLPAAEQIEDSIFADSSLTLPQSKRKNCIPADSTLKYRDLPYIESETELSIAALSRLVYLHDQLQKQKSDLKELKKSVEANNKTTQTKIKQHEEEIKILEMLLENPENPARMETLLYLEKCAEYGESMKIMPPSPEIK